jgi:hypothetical protein
MYCFSIADVQLAWDTATSSGHWNEQFWDVNDRNSLMVDPQFADPANGDFTILNPQVNLLQWGAGGY